MLTPAFALTDNVKKISEYRTKIENELKDICRDVLTVLDNHLIKNGEYMRFLFPRYLFVTRFFFCESSICRVCGLLQQDEGRLSPLFGRVHN